MTGNKIPKSSTKFMFFFGPIRKTRCLPRPLIGWDMFDFYSETAEWNSTKLDRNQDIKVLRCSLCGPLGLLLCFEYMYLEFGKVYIKLMDNPFSHMQFIVFGLLIMLKIKKSPCNRNQDRHLQSTQGVVLAPVGVTSVTMIKSSNYHSRLIRLENVTGITCHDFG